MMFNVANGNHNSSFLQSIGYNSKTCKQYKTLLIYFTTANKLWKILVLKHCKMTTNRIEWNIPKRILIAKLSSSAENLVEGCLDLPKDRDKPSRMNWEPKLITKMVHLDIFLVEINADILVFAR